MPGQRLGMWEREEISRGHGPTSVALRDVRALRGLGGRRYEGAISEADSASSDARGTPLSIR